MRQYIGVVLCIMGLFIAGCDPKPVLKTALKDRSIGVLSVVWNPNIQVEGRDVTLSLGPRHTEALTDAFLRGLAKVSNSWVRDANSVVLKEALAFYPDAPPPRKDGVALSVVSGYKWVALQKTDVALHWCGALRVDTVLTAILTPRAVFSADKVQVSVLIEFTVFNRQEGRIYTDTLAVPVRLSEDDQRWVLADPRRLPNVLISHQVVGSLSQLYAETPATPNLKSP